MNSNLYIVATPIGNLQDITIRAIKTLFTVDYICAEQPDKTSNLLTRLLIDYPTLTPSAKKPKIIPFNEAQEQNRIPEIITYLQNGSSVALVSEAGTPLLSDPGYKLVQAAWKRNIKVVPIPGASSIIASLSISPLPTDKFFFVGFLPKAKGKKINHMDKLKKTLFEMNTNNFSSTAVIFESPHRIMETLEAMKKIFGDIKIVVARELTKIYEEVSYKPISILLEGFKVNPPKGEIIILINLSNQKS